MRMRKKQFKRKIGTIREIMFIFNLMIIGMVLGFTVCFTGDIVLWFLVWFCTLGWLMFTVPIFFYNVKVLEVKK